MKKAICALLAATFLSAGMASGCSQGGDNPSTIVYGETTAAVNAPVFEGVEKQSEKKLKVKLLASFNAEEMMKIGGYGVTDSSFYYYTGHSKNDKEARFGIINSSNYKVESADYTFLEEASYQDAANVDKHYYICSKSTSVKDVADMNSNGLISTTGEELVPMQYAAIQVLNDRYAKVVTILGETKNKKEVLVYKNPETSDDRNPNTAMSNDATLYNGRWEVYDLKKKAVVKNVNGVIPTEIAARGAIIIVGDKYYNAKGELVSGVINAFKNGYYSVAVDANTSLNDINGKSLFQYDNRVTTLYEAFDDNTFLEQEKGSYFIVDISGKKVSADFNYAVAKAGSYYFAYSDDGYLMFDKNAKLVYGGQIKSFKYQKDVDVFCLCDNDDNYTYLDGSAKVIGKLPAATKSDGDYGIAYEISTSKYSVYNFKEGKFNIETDKAPKTCGMFSISNNSAVVNVLDNTALVNADYTSFATNGNGLVIAQRPDDSADLYKIIME